MFKKVLFLIIVLCFVQIQSVKAYEYNSFYNQPTKNQQVQNDFSEYMFNLQNKLKKNWISPDFLEEGHIRVLFKVDREGYVISGDITADHLLHIADAVVLPTNPMMRCGAGGRGAIFKKAGGAA